MSARAPLQRIAAAEQLDIAAVPEPESWALFAYSMPETPGPPGLTSRLPSRRLRSVAGSRMRASVIDSPAGSA